MKELFNDAGPENVHSENYGPDPEKPNPYAADRLVEPRRPKSGGNAGSSHGLVADRTIDPDPYFPNLFDEAAIIQREFDPDEIPAIRTVKSGLKYYYSGIYLVTFCFFVGSFLSRAIGPQMTTIIMFGTTLGAFIVLIGELKCLAVPRQAGGFHQVLLSVFFYSACVVLHILKHALEARANVPPEFFVQIGLLQLMAGFFANFFFLSFIVSLTSYMQNRLLHLKALKTRRDIWTMIGFVIVVFFTFVLLVNQRAGNAQQIAFIVLGVGAIGFFIMLYSWLGRFTRLVKETCQAINVE